MPQTAIRIAGIRKTHGRTVAVDDVSFDVEPGEIFGLIGPNGAGKTTTMECAEGLRRPGRCHFERSNSSSNAAWSLNPSSRTS